MSNLKLEELKKQYEELGREIERLRSIEEELEKEIKSLSSVENDTVFLLSTEEYEKYKTSIPVIDDWWWLRSSGIDCNHVIAIDCEGSIYSRGSYFDGTPEYVRPALRKPNLKSLNDRYICYCGTTWIKIDDDLYIAETPIAKMCFDFKSNKYHNSEVRKFLLNWYEQRKDWGVSNE